MSKNEVSITKTIFRVLARNTQTSEFHTSTETYKKRQEKFKWSRICVPKSVDPCSAMRSSSPLRILELKNCKIHSER